MAPAATAAMGISGSRTELKMERLIKELQAKIVDVLNLIEVTPDKKLIWKWRIPSQRTVVSVQVLDEKGDASKGEVYK